MRTRIGIAYGLIVVLVAVAAWEGYRILLLAQSVSDLKRSFAALDVEVGSIRTTASTTSTSVAELERRQQVVVKSQDEQLQDAVARVTPAVVSIVESKEVPLLQVTYQNPFGNDLFFQGFELQVPVYQQIGTTTRKVSAGTGFLVRSNGYLVTNRHVVPDANATYTVLLTSGAQREATVVWRSGSEDLAVLKIPGNGYAAIPLGDSSALALGESVFAVGNALGEYNNSVSVGIISGLNRSITAATNSGGSETLDNVIQTDAAINPGNSGGPLVNLSGQAVGVNVATVQGSQSIGFALPISKVRRALANLGI